MKKITLIILCFTINISTLYTQEMPKEVKHAGQMIFRWRFIKKFEVWRGRRSYEFLMNGGTMK